MEFFKGKGQPVLQRGGEHSLRGRQAEAVRWGAHSALSRKGVQDQQTRAAAGMRPQGWGALAAAAGGVLGLSLSVFEAGLPRL